MKILCSLIFSVLFFVSALGQSDKTVDSLQTVLKDSKEDVERIELYKKLFTKTFMDDPEVAKSYIDSIELLAKRVDPSKYQAILASKKGTYYRRITDYPKAETWYKKAVLLFEEENNLSGQMKAINSLGNVQRRMGKFELAMKSIQLVLQLKQKLNMGEVEIAKSYVTLGNLHGILTNLELSNEYFKKAEAIYLRNLGTEKSLAVVQGNIGLNLRKLDNYPEALSYYKKSLQYYEKEGPPVKEARILLNVASLYRHWDSLSLAESFANKSLLLTQEHNSPALTAKNHTILAKINHLRNQPQKALFHFGESIEINRKTNQSTPLSANYKNIADVYADLGDYKKAYEYRVAHFSLADSLFRRETVDKIGQLEVRYQTEKKEAEIALQEQEIKTLNEEVKVSNLTKTLYGIGMFAFLSIAGLLYFGFKQRMKKNRIAREKQEAIYKQEIEFKKKELTSQTLHLVQKNTFIEELKSNLERIKETPELFKIEFRRLILLLKKEKAEDKDWEVFKSYFSEVHNNFDLKLKEIYAEITEKEIRLASFLRMNLSTKEIASMLNVLPDSVLKSKYRLKKKLNLEKEEDLVSFLSAL